MLTFNHSTKRIGVPQADAQPLMIQTLVNSIRDEEASERGIVYDQIFDASGKEELGGGVTIGITAALRSTWKLEFQAGAYQATIDGGNLSDALQRIYNTGNPQVLVLSSAAATVVSGGGGGGAPTAAQNADAVANRIYEGSMNLEQIMRIMLAASAGKRQGLGTGIEQYIAQDGNTPRVTFMPSDQHGNGTTILNGN